MKFNAEILYVESDPKIFEDRHARCRHLLHFLAVRILGSEDEAEDAVRNCGAAASRNPPSFDSEGAFRSWLARILIDEACALLRRKQFSSRPGGWAASKPKRYWSKHEHRTGD